MGGEGGGELAALNIKDFTPEIGTAHGTPHTAALLLSGLCSGLSSGETSASDQRGRRQVLQSRQVRQVPGPGPSSAAARGSGLGARGAPAGAE